MKYDRFVGEVQHFAQLPSNGAAVAAIRATLETLAERLAGGEAKDLAAQLPREIAYYLMIGAENGPIRLSAHEFCERVAFREGVSLPQGIFHARAVFHVLRKAVSPGEMEDVMGQLPQEFAFLFEPIRERASNNTNGGAAMNYDHFDEQRHERRGRDRGWDAERGREYGQEAFRGQGAQRGGYGGVGNESWERASSRERGGNERDWEEERWRRQNEVSDRGQWAEPHNPPFRANQHGRWAGEQNQGWGQHDEREWRRAQEEGRQGDFEPQPRERRSRGRGSDSRESYRAGGAGTYGGYQGMGEGDWNRGEGWNDRQGPQGGRDWAREDFGEGSFQGRENRGWAQDERGQNYERFEPRRRPERQSEEYERGLGEGGWGREGERWTERQGGGMYQGSWNANRGEEWGSPHEQEMGREWGERRREQGQATRGPAPSRMEDEDRSRRSGRGYEQEPRSRRRRQEELR